MNTGSPDHDDKTVLRMDRLITMANQIGDFFAPYPPSGARGAFEIICEPIGTRACGPIFSTTSRLTVTASNPSFVEGALLLKSGADPTGYYGPPQDAETRRIAGAAGLTRRGHNPA